LAEWTDCVEQDPEFRLEAPDDVGGIEAGEAVWRPHSRRGESEAVTFRYEARSGQIEVLSPSFATLRKMSAVAAALGGQVVVEDGRTLEMLLATEKPPSRRSWWRRLLDRIPPP
jgi:hypothetical protein